MTIEEKTPIGSASRLLLDGAFRAIPGFEDGTYKGDQLPFLVCSPAMSLSTAAVHQGSALIPFNATIVKCYANLVSAPAGTGGGDMNIGTYADEDHFLDAYTFGTNHATGLIDLTDLTTMVNISIDAGDIVEFDTDGDATSGGVVAAMLICVPRLT